MVCVAAKPGDRERKWSKVRVVGQVDIRSYKVRMDSGKLFRRNRRHLRPSREPFGQTTETRWVPAPSIHPTPSDAVELPTESVRPQATVQIPWDNLIGQTKQHERVAAKRPPPGPPNWTNISCERTWMSFEGPSKFEGVVLHFKIISKAVFTLTLKQTILFSKISGGACPRIPLGP